MKTVTNIIYAPFALFALGCFVFSPISHAGSATWRPNPTSGDWNAAVNWNPATVPNGSSDIATFNSSNRRAISISQSTTVERIAFNSNASAFAISSSPGLNLDVVGAGIVNNSGRTQNFVNNADPTSRGQIRFFGTASAGSSTVFTNNGRAVGNPGISAGRTWFLESSTAGNGIFTQNGATGPNADGGRFLFGDSSTAGNGTFINNGSVSGALAGGGGTFYGSATAGNAIITINGATSSGAPAGFTQLVDTATGGNATFTNNGGTVSGAQGGVTVFFVTSTAGNATLICNGGSNSGDGGRIEFYDDSTGGTSRVELFGNGFLDNSFHNAPGVTVGSIEGDGDIFLGANNLTVGSNNLSTTFAGVIQDGGQNGGSGGIVSKIGSSILVLSGTNTYTGATTVNGGTLEINNNGTTSGQLLNTSLVTVSSGAKLLLSGAGNNNRINDAVAIALAGGTLQKGSGASEGSTSAAGLGTLILSANGSTLDYTGTAGVLSFESFSPNGLTVSVINFAANGALNGRSRLIFHADQAANLVHFDFGFGPGVNVAETNLGNNFYEVYPSTSAPLSVTINFDPIDASSNPVGGAALNNYLAQYGITISKVTPGSQVVVDDDRRSYGGGVVFASSPHNFLSNYFLNAPNSFTLNFDKALNFLSFTRIAGGPFPTQYASWTATALDRSGRVLSSVSEFSPGVANFPAKTFTLNGPKIVAVRFDSNGFGTAAFSAVLLDDLVLNYNQPTSTPTPTPTCGTPTALPQTTTTTENTQVHITLSGTDSVTLPSQLTYSVTTAPGNGTLSGGGRNLTYTPAAGFVGTDSFQFTVTNQCGNTSPPATVTINVTCPNTVISPQSPLITGTVGQPLSFTFNFNQPVISYNISPALPSGLSVTNFTPTSLTISGTATSQVVPGSITLSVTASCGTTVTTSFTIKITP
jgi:autotransporter-associated beta strand protein